MTDPQGLSRFAADLDAAVLRARRVATQARETSAKFRRETRPAAERAGSGAPTGPTPAATPETLRRAATGFRADHGLPVEKYPEPAPAAPVPAGPEFFAGRPGAEPGRRNAPWHDDDEDFSQERIMY